MHNLNTYTDLIKSGEVVAFPTETVYGLGADAWNPTAIAKVFKVKGRPSDNPLIVHISNKEQVLDFTAEINERAKLLMDAFWPGPLTLVFPKRPEVLDAITAGLNTVALRMPDHPMALKFIQKTGPLVAPSANTSGKPSPTRAEHVRNDFGDDFPVIDGGATAIGLESTVLDLSSPIPVILRPGKIGSEELSTVLGTDIELSDETIVPDKPHSPGQKYSHYKPKAKVLYGRLGSVEDNTLYLVQNEIEGQPDQQVCYHGDLELLSKELYDRFRQADLKDYAQIFIEDLSDHAENHPSLALALVNRIKKSLSD